MGRGSMQTQTCEYNGANFDKPLKWAMGGSDYARGWEETFGSPEPTVSKMEQKCGCCHEPLVDGETVDYTRSSDGKQVCRHTVPHPLGGMTVFFRKGK